VRLSPREKVKKNRRGLESRRKSHKKRKLIKAAVKAAWTAPELDYIWPNWALQWAEELRLSALGVEG
tara:strand:- start:273 stop:473 length:201 start_codon:yes stop_codon:yes gene_type:complete